MKAFPLHLRNPASQDESCKREGGGKRNLAPGSAFLLFCYIIFSVMNELCIGILAHVDAGKTTCIESFFTHAGVIRSAGRVDHGTTVFDSDPKEREHGITIYSKEASFQWKDTRIHVIDTPGHVDFSGEMERVLSVLDMAVVLISGLDGVQAHTETILNCLDHYHIPRLFFINKMDIARHSKEELLEDLNAKFSNSIDWDSDHREEDLAMVNEELLNEYLETQRTTSENVKQAIRQCQCAPVYFGSALKDQGMEELLDAIVTLFEPKPVREEFGARVFKITSSNEGKLAHVRVSGGVLKARMALTEEEKADRVYLLNGATPVVAPEATAGQIAILTGTHHLKPGQGLGFEAEHEPVSPLIEPCLSYELHTENDRDQRVLYEACATLAEEEPTLSLLAGEDDNTIHISVMGEMQKEILRYRLKELTGMDVEFGQGTIVFRETIQSTVHGAGHFEPLRHYAEVHVRLEPGARDSGISVRSECSADELPMHYQNAILNALSSIPHRGVLTGALLTDVNIVLTAGKGHLKHTEGGDLRNASRRAVRQALMKGDSILLEPYCHYELSLSSQYLSHALYDLERRDASVTVTETPDGIVLEGKGPLRTMLNMQGEVTSYTRGTGHCVVMPCGYEPCVHPEPLIEASGYDPLLDLRNPASSVFCSHGSSFTVSWEEADAFMTIPVKDRTREGSYSHRTYHVGEEELKSIIASESGNNRNPNKTMREKEKVVNYKPAKPSPELPECLIVDGYNLLHSRGSAEGSITVQREELIDELAAYQAYLSHRMIVVFDGYQRKDNAGSEFRNGNLEIVYTRTGQTADAYIEKLVGDLTKQYRITVVTSDALIQNSIFSHGAMRISSRMFLEEMEQVKKMFASA